MRLVDSRFLVLLLIICFNNLHSLGIKAQKADEVAWGFYNQSQLINIDEKLKKNLLLKSFELSIINKIDTLTLLTSCRLAKFYFVHMELNPDSALFYSLLGSKFFSEIKLPEEEVSNNILLSIIYKTKNKLDSSLYYCNQSEVIIEKNKNKISLEKINSLYGFKFHVLLELMKYKDALNLIDTIKLLALKSGNLHDLLKYEINYAKLYNEAGDSKSEIKHLHKALKNKSISVKEKYVLYNMLGQTYEKLNCDSSVYFYKKCLILCKSELNYYTNSILFQLTNVCSNCNLKDEAILYAKQIDTNQIKKQLPCQFQFLKAKLTDDIFSKENLCLEAIACNPSLNTQKEIYEYLNTVFTNKNEFKSAIYYRELNLLKDSLATKSRRSEIQKAILRKELSKKDYLLNRSDKKNKNQINKSNFFLRILIFLLILISFLMFFVKKIYKKKGSLLKEKKFLQDEINKKNKLLEDACFSIEKNIKFIERTKNNIDKASGLNNLQAEIKLYLKEIKRNKEFNSSIENIKDDFFVAIGKSFTSTERKIIVLLKIDLSTKEIADTLNVKVSSVEKYRYNIRRKFKLAPKESLSSHIKSF